MSNLFVAATPIGNLGDVSERFLDTLKSVDVIFAEDTRVTKKITSHFDISTPVRRYNEHNPEKTFKKLGDFYNEGRDIALVSDSGTPGISDPGFKLVQFTRKHFPDVSVRVIPGPSAVTAALSVSGIPSNEFTFLGFPPAKNKRNSFFEKVKNIDVAPIVLYESPHRLEKTLSDIENIIGNIIIFIGKEMTKIHEDYFLGSVSEAKKYFSGKKGKGEFVIIIPND